MSGHPEESVSTPYDPNNGEEILKAALDSHQTITLRALDVIPPDARLTVYILWTLSALAAVTGIVFVVSGSQVYGFIVVLAAFVCICASVYWQNKPTQTSSERFGRLAQGQVSAPSWTRVIPKVPISQAEKLDAFQISLRQLRTIAVTQLNLTRKNRNNSEIDDRNVRINVFLANSHDMAEAGALVLTIPSRLQDNMTGFNDRKIRILPHEGLTGRTFTLGEACGATAVLENGTLRWSKVGLFPGRPSRDDWEGLPLSDEQKALIGTRLRWIASFPLKYSEGNRDKPFAVLNIDGIDQEITVDDMQSLAMHIEPSVNEFASRLAELSKVRITIRVEEVLQ